MRTKTGTVIASRPKTIVVRVERYVTHPKYAKRYRVCRKFHAHDPKSSAQVGDKVEITETRPLSKLKCYQLKKVWAQKGRVAATTPAAVETAAEVELKEVAQVEKDKPLGSAEPEGIKPGKARSAATEEGQADEKAKGAVSIEVRQGASKSQEA